ncbi:zinc-ribbon domain-containing protein, partial [Turicibacter sanguinis]|nr:zinc-ribbon domain-containing protein [Turicibacter sanguinis]
SESVSKKFCSECGNKVAQGAKFCNECGFKLN